MTSSSSTELLRQAMSNLASDDRVVFIGQSVGASGTAMFETLSHISQNRRLEFPVAEELQLGCSLGLSIAGFVPVSVFPRVDFLWRAADQLINHLDKLNEMSRGNFNPKVIIRTRVGSRTPLDAGPQHTGSYTKALRSMLTTVKVVEITKPQQIVGTYEWASWYNGSVLIVEAL